MTQRRLENWLDSYLHFTRYDEAPENFHKWTALGILSAAVNRNCWMDRGYYRTFPNLYILFVGPSGIGKSSSSGIGLELLRETTLKIGIFTDFITPAALLTFMKDSLTVIEVDSKLIYKTPILLYASELGTLLSERAGVRELTLLLTELFNKPGDHEDSTAARGRMTIKNPNMTFFACCFPEWIDEVLSSISLRSGFLGRMLIIKESSRRHRNPNVHLSMSDLQLREDLIHDLTIIGNLYGEMTWDTHAQIVWDRWYEEQPLDLDSDDSVEVKGFANRRAQFIQRLAMLSCLSRTSSLKVSIEDYAFGFKHVLECEENTRTLKVKPPHMIHVEKIRSCILRLSEKKKTKLIPIADIAMRTFRSVSTKDREETINQLCSIGFCELQGRKIKVIDEKAGA